MFLVCNIFIDQSKSMNSEYSQKYCSQWSYLATQLQAHISQVIERFKTDELMCNRIGILFYSNYDRHRNSKYISIERDPIQLYLNNLKTELKTSMPQGSSYIVPILKQSLDKWLLDKQDNDNYRYAIIIYTDGQLADRIELANLIADTCRKINNQNKLKIVMIGVGIDERSEIQPEFYQRIANNYYDFRDKNNESCQIFSFYLIDDMPENITDIFTGHFNGNTERGISDG